MTGPTYVPLACHSYYSFMRGVDGVETLCRAARSAGLGAVALTDVNGLYGAVRFWETACEAGVQPILGADARAAGERAILLAADARGYRRLGHILTAIHTGPGCQPSGKRAAPRSGAAPSDPPFSLSRVLLADRIENEARGGLLVLSASVDLLGSLVADSGTRDLYAALPARSAHRHLLDFSARYGVPPVALPEVCFIRPEGYAVHRLLRAIALNTRLGGVPPEELAPPHAVLRTSDEAEALYPHRPDALTRSVELAERCAMADPPWGEIVLPPYGEGPEHSGPSGCETPFDLLRRRCLAGARRRYGEISTAVTDRLDYELGIIRDKGLAPYFLVVEEIVHDAPLTCGRGSAAASIVSYCLGITHVDPIRYDLFFDRFLNPGRVDPPDIDVDFPWDERDEVLSRAFERHGRGRAAMVANHVTFRARAAVREIAKVYGLPDAEIKTVTRRLSHYWGADLAETGEHCAAGDPGDADRGGQGAGPADPGIPARLRDLDLGEPWPEILGLAARIEGIPRHLSVHCGGVVITPDPVCGHVPVETAAKGVPVLQWEKDAVEDAGLVKIDLLGNRSLAVIRDALAAVKENHGVEIPYWRLNPLDDVRTREILARGDTIGVFYVESPAMRQLQKKTRRGDFEHLVIHSSIIRPAANEFIREYVRRLHGGAYRSPHPLMDEILGETYGIMCYQEDVSRIAMAMAGFDAAAADDLRKILSKKHRQRRIEDYRQRFYEGASARGVGRDVIDRVWAMILSFRGYSFCKPHSASYALVSFKSAYLKAHYPAEFMAAVISNQGGYYGTFAYVSEARRMGLRVLGPDVNASEIPYTGSGRTLRIGLMQLKGLGRAAAEAIVAERARGGPFASIDDLLSRADLDPSDVRTLIRAGCLDSISGGLTRAQLQWKLIARHGSDLRTGRSGGREPELPLGDRRRPPPRAPAYDEATLLGHEVDTLGFLASRHPLTLYRSALARIRRIRADELHRHVGRRVNVVGWFVTAKEVLTKKNEPMEFTSFEDTTAIYETTFFPATYRKFRHKLSHTRPYVLRGRVEEDFGAVALTVEDLAFLDAPLPAWALRSARETRIAEMA